MATASGGGGTEPPDVDASRNKQTMPDWMDRNGEFGKAHFLVLKPEEGRELPKNPFMITKTIQNAVGEIERAHTEANRTRYVLKVRKQEQADKLVIVKKLLDGTPISIAYHPTLNYVKCVVTCWEAIDMTEAELMECLGPQGVTHVQRMTRKREGKVQNLPTFKVWLSGRQNAPVHPRPNVVFQLLGPRTHQKALHKQTSLWQMRW